MSKAYDRVEWLFLDRMMSKIGFDSRWTNLIMQCVSTVSYRFKVNGEMTEDITPTRGLRQGDPLSPYLFLICAEGFSALLNQAEEEGELEGVTICALAPSITHLLFADDSLLLLKANEMNASHLQHILQLYDARGKLSTRRSHQFCLVRIANSWQKWNSCRSWTCPKRQEVIDT